MTAAASSAELAARIARLPAEIAAACRTSFPDLTRSSLSDRPLVATGAGASEGPARTLSDSLAHAGLPSRFVPLSAFAGSQPPLRDDEALVVFSQGLSPNARIALRGRSHHTVVVTAVAPDPDAPTTSAARHAADLEGAGVARIPHGPEEETGLLLRVLGPPLATLAALRLAAHLTERPLPLADLHAAVDAARPPVPALPEPLGQLALVTAGAHQPAAHGLRWKLLEGIAAGDPPIWDVLQFVHGAFQQFYDRPLTLLALEYPESPQSILFERLERLLHAPHHRLIRLRASLPGPLGWFEHDAMLDALLLAELARQPRDLADWPGKGEDRALYDIDEPL
ncbi:MAG: hypothetical protein R3B72_25190 [Polyangiaceae bacterium]